MYNGSIDFGTLVYELLWGGSYGAGFNAGEKVWSYAKKWNKKDRGE